MIAIRFLNFCGNKEKFGDLIFFHQFKTEIDRNYHLFQTVINAASNTAVTNGCF